MGVGHKLEGKDEKSKDDFPVKKDGRRTLPSMLAENRKQDSQRKL